MGEHATSDPTDDRQIQEFMRALLRDVQALESLLVRTARSNAVSPPKRSPDTDQPSPSSPTGTSSGSPEAMIA